MLQSPIVLLGTLFSLVQSAPNVPSGIEYITLRSPTMANNAKTISRLLDVGLSKRQRTVPLVGNKVGFLFVYQGSVNVGTPSQSFNVLFDTGSPDLWLKDKECTATPACIDKVRFDKEASTTFVDLNETAPMIRYADGTEVRGDFVEDTVEVGGVKIPNFKFQLARYTNDAAPIDGMIGLSLARRSDGKTVWDEVRESGVTHSPVISYYISSTAQSGGITFGGIDLARFSGELTWVQVMNSAAPGRSLFWRLGMDSVSIGSQRVTFPEVTQVIVDTGTALTKFPYELAHSINTQLGLQPVEQGFYGVMCPLGTIPENMKVLKIQFGGKAVLRFTANEYLFLTAVGETVYCLSGIQADNSTSSTPLLILGNSLLQRYYTVFDYGKKAVGFATANRNPNVTSRLVAADSSVKLKGVADPATVFGETTSSLSGASHSLCISSTWIWTLLLLWSLLPFLV